MIDVEAESNGGEPLPLLDRWLKEARAAGAQEPGSVAFVTVGEGGRPSARTVSLKRLEDDALVFTSALWTRKAREIERNPQVALLFHWPTLGRQVHITGLAAVAERELAVQLFSERELSHRVQTLVSRQGEPIDEIEVLRARHAHLMDALEAPPECPPDWGAIRVIPNAVEFWLQAPDRMHDRLLYERSGGDPARGIGRPGRGDQPNRGGGPGGDDPPGGTDADRGPGWSTTRLSP